MSLTILKFSIKISYYSLCREALECVVFGLVWCGMAF